jgi:hypothetical protein
MIISHGVGADRRVLLADANPAIGALPVATLTPLPDSSRRVNGLVTGRVADAARRRPVSG